jgi:hypothetical protein
MFACQSRTRGRGYAWAYEQAWRRWRWASICRLRQPQRGTAIDTLGADTVEQLPGAAVFGIGLAASLLAITWVQSLSPPPLPRAAVVARWCVIGIALVVGAFGAWLPPLVQVGVLAVGMVVLVLMCVRLAYGSHAVNESMSPPPAAVEEDDGRGGGGGRSRSQGLDADRGEADRGGSPQVPESANRW